MKPTQAIEKSLFLHEASYGAFILTPKYVPFIYPHTINICNMVGKPTYVECMQGAIEIAYEASDVLREPYI